MGHGRRNRIVGGPGWLDSYRFRIIAKSERPAGDQALMQMLQTLLADRFGLRLLVIDRAEPPAEN